MLFDPTLRFLARSTLVKVGLAIGLASAIVISTNGTLENGLRYLAAICLLLSLSSAVSAIARRDPARAESLDWGQALILSLAAAGAHLLADFFK